MNTRANITFDRRVLLVIHLLFSVCLIYRIAEVGAHNNFIISFILSLYLIVVPGYMILKILNIHNNNKLEQFLCSVGASISIIVVEGLILEFLLRSLRPEFDVALYYAISTIIFVIYFIEDYKFSIYVDVKDVNFIVISLLMIFLSVLGAYLTEFRSNNLLIFVLLIGISIFPLMPKILKNNGDKSRYYPVLLFAVSLSLIYHNLLSSLYLQGSDILEEYFFARLVYSHFYWLYKLPYNYNSILCDVLFAPLFSIIASVPLVFVFKLVIPTVFSLVPLGLFTLYKKQTNDDVAYLAVFFFMSYFAYYTQPLISNAKQMMAEFFLILILVELYYHIEKNYMLALTSFILIGFTSILCVFHYATIFLYILILLIASLTAKLVHKFYQNKKINLLDYNIRANYILFMVILALGWYIYIANSSVYMTILTIARNIYINLVTHTTTPIKGSGLYWIHKKLPLSWEILRLLNYISQIFIIIGIIIMIKFAKRKNSKFLSTYLFISVSCLILLLGSIVLPHFVGKGSIDIIRVYHFTLIFLSPFCVIGGTTILNQLKRKMTTKNSSINILLIIFLILYFIFSCGIVSEIIQETYGHDYCFSPSLSQPRIKVYGGSIREKIAYYGINHPIEDIYSASWIGQHKISTWDIFSDAGSFYILSAYGMIDLIHLQTLSPYISISKIYNKNSYLYLRKLNYVYDIMQIKYLMQKKLKYPVNYWSTSKIFKQLIIHKDKIYDNGNSVIFDLNC